MLSSDDLKIILIYSFVYNAVKSGWDVNKIHSNKLIYEFTKQKSTFYNKEYESPSFVKLFLKDNLFPNLNNLT